MDCMEDIVPSSAASKASLRVLPGCPTQRELECLQGVALGLKSTKIAQRMCISERTVDHHIGNVMLKLEAPTRAAAVARALQAGLIDI